MQYIIDPFGNPGADVVGQVKGFQWFTVEHENEITKRVKIPSMSFMFWHPNLNGKKAL